MPPARRRSGAAPAPAPAPAPATTGDARFKFAYVGTPTPTTLADQVKAINDNDAKLVIASNHIFTAYMPDALDLVTFKPDVGVPMDALFAMFVGGCIMDADVYKQGMHFSITPDRLSQFVKDLDASGVAWEPIEGADVEAFPKAILDITAAMLKLSDQQRLLEQADVLYDSDPKDAETGEWYDKISPSMLASGDGGMDMVAQFVSIIPDGYTKDGRDGDEFKSAVAQILGSVGRDVSALPAIAQAAAVAQWFKRSRPPHEMTPYVVNKHLEIERRAGTDAQARFAPIFVIGWRVAYPFLAKLWPNRVEDILTDTAGLMISLDVADGSVTPQGMRALAIAMKDYEAFATEISNEDRTAQVIHAHKHAGDDKDETADHKALLQADTEFQAFRSSIEKHRPDDHIAIARTAMGSKHPAGILFLNGLMKSDTFFKARAGARTPSSIQAIFNNAVARNAKGDVRDDWTNLLPDDLGKKFLAGQFAEIHFWNAFKKVVLKREGKMAHDDIDKRLASASNAEVFADAEALRCLETPVRAVMALIGFSSTDEHSFGALWRMLTRMAAAIENLPSTCQPKKGLRKTLLDTSTKLLRCPQARWECMLATPATAVTRIGSFVTAGHALNAVHALDAQIDRFMQEVDDGMHLCARDPDNNARDIDDAPTKPDKKSGFGSEQKSEVAWGSLATKFGIYTSADGKRIAWGDQCVTDFDSAPDLKDNCPGHFAPGSSVNAWCTSPGACWARAGDKAHERLPDFPKEACKATSIGKLQPPMDWDAMTVTIKAPAANQRGGGRNANGKREREDDGRRQGKGKGKGAGKGKGKGGGGNGGKGRGRGFQRQPQ